MLWIALLLIIAGITEATSYPLVPLPFRPVSGNYTEEVWIYLLHPLSSTFSIFYEEGRSEMKLATSGISLWATISSASQIMTPEVEYLPKPRRWLHVAVSFFAVNSGISCNLFTNGRMTQCLSTIDPITLLLSAESRALFSSTDSTFSLFNLLYYRNYRIWDGMLSESQLATVMTKSKSIMVDSIKIVGFLSFTDGDRLQQDQNITAGKWLVLEESEINPPSAEFLRASHEFDSDVLTDGQNTDFLSEQDTLRINMEEGKTGPALFIPRETLIKSESFTVELWLAFEDTSSANITIVGMAGKNWYEGFGMGGVMNSTAVTLGCMLDNTTVYCSSTTCDCSTNTDLCLGFTTATRVWKHFLCARTGNNKAQLMLDSAAKEVTVSPVFEAPMETLFSSNVLFLGTQSLDADKEAGFNGYIKELRIWSRYLSKYEALEMMYKRLSPNDHAALLGYWPLSGGRGSEFFDNSAHSVVDVSFNSPNETARGLYSIGSFSWETVGGLWTLPLCSKFQEFNVVNNTCFSPHPNMAFYTNKVPFQANSGTNKGTLSTWDLTFSAWVYHSNYSGQMTIFNVTNAVNVILSHSASFTLTAKYQGSNAIFTDWTLTSSPTLGKWNYYGFITSSIARTFMLNSVSNTASHGLTLTTLPSSIDFSFGNNLQGYLREIKVWKRGLSLDELVEQKYKEASTKDSGLLAYWKLKEGTSNTALDYSAIPSHVKISDLAGKDSNWLYVDEKLKANLQYQETRLGSAKTYFSGAYSNTRLPRSTHSIMLHSGVIDSSSQTSIEFWFKPIIKSTETTFIDLRYPSGTVLWSISEKIVSPNWYLVFDAITGTTGLTLLTDFTSDWHYISIHFGSSKAIYINGTFISAYSLSDFGSTVELYLNLNESSFREVKAFNKVRTIEEMSLFAHTQSDVSKEDLLFYYPLTSDFYLLNAMSPEKKMNKLMQAIRWEKSPDEGFHMCPPGYYYQVNSALIQGILDAPTCHKYSYLRLTSSSPVDQSLELLSSSHQYYLLTGWIYYYSQQTSTNLFVLDSASNTPITLQLNSDTIIALSGSTPVITQNIAMKRWVHVAYSFSSSGSKFYLYSRKVQDYSSSHNFLSSGIKLQIGQVNACLSNWHIIGSLVEIAGFYIIMESSIYPSTTTTPEILAYIPGYSIDSSKALYIFKHNSPALTIASEEISEYPHYEPLDSLQNPGSASKFIVGSTPENIEIIRSSSLLLTDAMTIELWVNIGTISASGYYQLEVPTNSQPKQSMIKVMNNMFYYFKGTKTSYSTVANKWTHLALVMSSNDNLYVDHATIATSSHSSPSASYTYVCSLTFSDVTVTLKMLRVWKGAFSLDQMKQLAYVRIPQGIYNLHTIATFEPFLPSTNYFPVYQYGTNVISSLVKSSNLYPVSAGSNPLQCSKYEYFAGTRCLKTNVLYLKKGTTPGLIIPIRKQIAKNLEWTLETWAFVGSSYTDNSIIAIQGDSAKLGVRSSGTSFILDWVYSTSGETKALSGVFVAGQWNYVAVTSRVDLPYFIGEAILNCETKLTINIMYPSSVKKFSKLVLGMDISDQSLMGEVALKEIRLWKSGSTMEILKHRMRRRINHPESEPRLLNYYRIDSDENEYLDDSGYEGKLTRLRLWNTPFSYQYPAGSSDLSTIVPPKVILPTDISIQPLILCDENSFYSGSRCQRDVSEGEFGYELSNGPITLPLYNYNLDIEWTFDYWMQIQEISGVDSYVFRQICYPSKAGEIRLKKSGMSQTLIFSLSQMSGNISFELIPREWTHYAFMHSIKTGYVSMYMNGVKQSAEIPGYSDYFYKCKIQIGEESTSNIIYGKLREVKFYNGTRTTFKLLNHKIPIIQYESQLAFYLPLDDGSGLSVRERQKGAEISLPAIETNREVWISQGDLKLCREPFTYSESAHVCVLPRARLLDTNTLSMITVPYTTPIVEAEVFEFWIRIYTPAVITLPETTSVTLIEQANHFAFVVGSSTFTFKILDSPVINIASTTISDFNKWIFVAGLIGQNKIKSFLQIDDSAVAESGTPNALTGFYLNNIVMYANINPTGNNFVAGIREFKIFSHYRAPAEIIERRFDVISNQSYGLELYLKLDESSGEHVLEHVSGIKYPVSADYWDKNQDPQTINNGAYSPQLKSGLSLAIQDNQDHYIAVSANSYIMEDFTFMVWLKFSTLGKITIMFSGSALFKAIIDLKTSPKIISIFGTSEMRSRGTPIVSGKWQSYTYTRNPSTGKGYINGEEFSCDDVTVTALASIGNFLYFKLGQNGIQVSVKELRVLGAALSPAEVRIATFSKINLWEYANFNLYKFGLQNFPSYNIEDWGIDHGLLYKGISSFTSRRVALSSFNWISDDLPSFCASNEIYDSINSRCISQFRSLMFIRGRTHSIGIQSEVIEQNFTLEFWVNIHSNQSSSQQIMKSDYFIISYENDSRYKVSMFNETTAGHKTYNSTSTNQFGLRNWTHLAIGNSETVGKSVLIVNGALEGQNKFIVISGAFSEYVLSHETCGFTGLIKNFVIWREFRSQGLLSYEMRQFQWYNHFKNFNLYGHFALMEGYGTALRDYYASSPNDIATFKVTKTGYISPFWTEDNDFPFLCKFPMFFDQALHKCRAFKKILKVGTTAITLPVKYQTGFREWSFKAWIKFNDISTISQTIITIPSVFSLQITAANTAKVFVATDNSASTFVNTFSISNTNTWYVFSVGYSYSANKLISEMRPILDTTTLYTHPTGVAQESTYYGAITIHLYNAKFAHISMWKKYSPLTGILVASTTEMNDGVYLPGQHNDLIAYYPLEESAGTVLHDTSIFGSTVDVGSSVITWEYESGNTGRVLYSKYYQSTINNEIPSTKSCSTNCNYCGTSNYCKACARGAYLQNGACIITISAGDSPNYYQDLLEREYKPKPSSGYCVSSLCKTCTDANGVICQAPSASTYCIRNALYYNGNCYGACPIGSYQSGNTCISCSLNCEICTSLACTKCSEGYILNAGSTCQTTTCGDGIVQVPETCDDGNQIDGDGCSKYCLIEADFSCIMLPSQGPSVCTPICGDGKFYGLSGEECDDGNTNSGDGCDFECKLEANWWCEGGSPTSKSTCHCSPQHLSSYNVYSNSYMTISFKFSLNIASLISVSNSSLFCKQIFGSQVSKFGSSYSCSIYEDVLVLNLGTGTTLKGGEILSVLSGVIGTLNCLESFGGNVTVPSIPAQIITGNIIVSSKYHYCLDNTIWISNVQGDLKRPFNTMAITSEIISGGSSDDINIANQEEMNYVLSKYVKKNSSAYYIRIPANTMLSSAVYVFTLTLKNFQDISYTTTANFSSTELMLIDLLLEGLDGKSLMTVSSNTTVTIRAVPTAYQCGVAYPNLTNIAVNFTQVGGAHILDLPAIVESSGSSRFLIFSSGVLLSGYSYNFMVIAQSGSVSESSNFSISVVDPDLVAVAKPIFQSIPTNNLLQLYGHQSYDPMNSQSTAEYKWKCYNSTDNFSKCKFSNGTLLGTYKITNLSLPAYSFDYGSHMVFVLGFSKDNRSAKSNATVYIMDDSSPEVQLIGPTSSVQLKDIIHIRLDLPSLSASLCTFSWEIEGCPYNSCIVGDTDNNYVRIKVDKINPLLNNQFNVTGIVYYLTKNSTATLIVEVDDTPTAGTLSVIPTVGEGWRTNYTIKASDFSLTSGNSPRYQFFLVDDSQYMAISSLSKENRILTMLPTGNISENYILNISVRAYNEKGGYTEVSTPIQSLKLINSESVQVVYSLLKENFDCLDPINMMRQAAIGSLLLSQKPDKVKINSSDPCNSNGIYTTSGNCYCTDGYKKRIDCSISDAQFNEESKLAVQIIKFLETNSSELAKYQPQLFLDAVGSVISKSDLINDTIRGVARNLLEKCMNESSSLSSLTQSQTSLMKYLDLSSSTSSSAQTKQEYTQINRMLSKIIQYSWNKSDQSLGNASELCEMTNLDIQYAILRGSMNKSLTMNSVTFPESAFYLSNTDNFVSLTVTKWKTSQYPWISTSNSIKSKLISIEVKDLEGNAKTINSVSSPINISFDLDVNSLSGQVLSAMRCLFYNETLGYFSVNGMNFVDVNITSKVGQCQTTHLSDFAMGLPQSEATELPDPEKGTFVIFGITVNPAKIYKSPFFWFTLAITILMAGIFVYGYRKENSQSELGSLMSHPEFKSEKELFDGKHEKTEVNLKNQESNISVNDSALGSGSNRSGGPEGESQISGGSRGSGGSAEEGSAECESVIEGSVENESVKEGSEKGDSVRSYPDNFDKVEDFKLESGKNSSERSGNPGSQPDLKLGPEDKFDQTATPEPKARPHRSKKKKRVYRRKKKIHRKREEFSMPIKPKDMNPTTTTPEKVLIKPPTVPVLLLKAHEYTGLFAFSSPDILLFKRVALLYTKLCCIILFCSLVFVIENSIDPPFWIGFGFAAALGGNIIEVCLRMMVKKRQRHTNTSPQNEEEDKARKRTAFIEYIVNFVGLGLMAAISITSMVIANLIASDKTKDHLT